MKLKRVILQFAISAALSQLAAGCATAPLPRTYVTPAQPPSEALRARLGAVAVVSAEPGDPALGQRIGKGGAAGKGAWRGFVAAPAIGAAAGNGYGFVLGLFVSPVTALGGAVYGASVGISESKYAEITNTLQAAMREADPAADLRNRIVEKIRQFVPRTTLAPSGAPATAQTTLEIVPAGITLTGGSDLNPPLTLHCTIAVRLLAADGAELYCARFEGLGDTHTLREWADAGGALFRDNISATCNELAGEIVERVFLVYTPDGFTETRTVPCDL